MSSQPTAPYQDALTLLSEDHQEIQEMFREFADLSDTSDRRMLLRRVSAALNVHTLLEEELFYPALRELLSESDMIDEAEVEHDLAKTLLAELEEMDVRDALFDDRFNVLVESVSHHFAEEETEMFAQVRADAPDLEALAQEMRERKEELQAELEPDDDENETDEDDDEARGYEDD